MCVVVFSTMDGQPRQPFIYLFINYLLCHLYPGVPHQCATLFSLGLLHYIHDNTNINQYTFSSNTVITWHMYMLTTYSYTCFSLNIACVSSSSAPWMDNLVNHWVCVVVFSTMDGQPCQPLRVCRRLQHHGWTTLSTIACVSSSSAPWMDNLVNHCLFVLCHGRLAC